MLLWFLRAACHVALHPIIILKLAHMGCCAPLLSRSAMHGECLCTRHKCVPSCIHAFAVPLVGCVCVLVNVWDGSKAHVEGCRLIIAGQVQHRVVSKALEDDDYDDTRQHESMP